MRTISSMLQAVSKINVMHLAENAVHESRDILKKQQQDQMFSGYDNDDKQINPLHGRYTGYAERTRQIKRSKGQIDKWVTLKDEGDFYKEIFIDVRANEFVIDSTDEKTGRLIDYYGESIFGFNKDSRKDLKEPLTIAAIQQAEIELNKK